MTKFLSPNIDKEISAKMELDRKLGDRQSKTAKPAITISRSFGCEAFPLSVILKSIMERKTGETWQIIDRVLIEEIHRKEGIPLRLLSELGDESRILDKFAPLFGSFTSHPEAFMFLPKLIYDYASNGNVIIVGRGGAIITQDMPNCFHFRLDAPIDYRIKSIATRKSISLREAEAFVRSNERTREKFIEECLGQSVRDPSLYSAIYNNARMPLEVIAQTAAYSVNTTTKTGETHTSDDLHVAA